LNKIYVGEIAVSRSTDIKGKVDLHLLSVQKTVEVVYT